MGSRYLHTGGFLSGAFAADRFARSHLVCRLKTIFNKIMVSYRPDGFAADFTSNEPLTIQDGAADGENPFAVLFFHLHGVVGAVLSTGAAGNAFFGRNPEVGFNRVVEIEISQLKRVNFHSVPTDFDAVTTAPADITPKTPGGFLPDIVFSIA